MSILKKLGSIESVEQAHNRKATIIRCKNGTALFSYDSLAAFILIKNGVKVEGVIKGVWDCSNTTVKHVWSFLYYENVKDLRKDIKNGTVLEVTN